MCYCTLERMNLRRNFDPILQEVRAEPILQVRRITSILRVHERY